MVVVTSGKDWKGEDCEFFLEDNLLKNIEPIKKVVTTKDFDYVAIVCGLPGAGKSNFSMNLAKYFCPWFDETYIAFTAEQFIDITNNAPRNSSVILDESFASLNSKTTMTSEFVRIINHLQLIRQKNLFIFLNLPNFFDLAKGIAIYRAHHLFVVYGAEFGDRGSFAAYGREEKKMLYILGQKYMNYLAVNPNFRGRFVKQKAILQETYEKLKANHLKEQENTPTLKHTNTEAQRDRCIAYMKLILEYKVEKLAEITELSEKTIYNHKISCKV